MALTPSNMIPLGTTAPGFSLLDVLSGKHFSLHELKGDKGTVVMFICNHCPYVKHISHQLAAVANNYQSRGIAFIAINSNDMVQYPEDAPDKMIAFARASGFNFPYLFDETQDVAKNYDAACTPDFYVFDSELKLFYRGQFDDARPGNDTPPSGKDVCNALDALVQGQSISPAQRPSIGCNIKWKKA